MAKASENLPVENDLSCNHDDFSLEDVVQRGELQEIMDEFYRLTGFGIGILNQKGNVVVATGWQDICLNFHRAHAETCKNCVESDVALTKKLRPGEVKQYKCKNNMWDIMTPIFVKEKHIGNICHGQFFFDDDVIDYDFYRAQAKRYGFDEDAYLAALAKVPIRRHDTILTLMNFYAKFAHFVSSIGVKNRQLSNLLAERNALLVSLHDHETSLLAINQEMAAAYQQLEASDEELQAQYYEIQEANFALEALKVKYEYLSYHDYLTDLPNRRHLIEKLSEEILHNRCFALILLDVDNFKNINDTLGHSYGDKLLKKIANKLAASKAENNFVARIGGDEFIIILFGEDDVVRIDRYARQILHQLNHGFDIDGNDVDVKCSMGISLYPSDSDDIHQLLMNVDMAMYAVKKAEKNNYLFFNLSMVKQLKDKINIENILREALKHDGFKILYQPQICTSTGKAIGFEALLRLKSDLLSPGIFIPIAEETGLIIEIGRWVTKEVIRQIAEWKERGLAIQPVSINFSAKQLHDMTYISYLADLLQKKQLHSKYIEIEITESVYLKKEQENIVFLHQLKELGINLALDDFGTGYSSLSYLYLFANQ